MKSRRSRRSRRRSRAVRRPRRSSRRRSRRRSKSRRTTRRSTPKIKFYLASWCDHCMDLKKSGVIKKLKKEKDIVTQVIDCSDGCAGVNAFPTIKIKKNGRREYEYEGERSFESLKRELMN